AEPPYLECHGSDKKRTWQSLVSLWLSRPVSRATTHPWRFPPELGHNGCERVYSRAMATLSRIRAACVSGKNATGIKLMNEGTYEPVRGRPLHSGQRSPQLPWQLLLNWFVAS